MGQVSIPDPYLRGPHWDVGAGPAWRTAPNVPAVGFPPELLGAASSSFADLARRLAPSLLPQAPAGSLSQLTPHGTTLVAVTYTGGVVMAGDRRATMGNEIAQRDIEKVFSADEWSIVGIAGAAGLATELVRLFQVELQHYEKIEGGSLSLDGKANRLAAMIRENLPMAMQGLAVVPLFAGWDQYRQEGRIYSYDATGGKYEETAFHAVGSGAAFARGSLKKIYRADLDEQGAATAVIQALFDAADDDSATGGPDLTRRIFPVVISASASGVRRIGDDEVSLLTRQVVTARMNRPDGPNAGLL